MSTESDVVMGVRSEEMEKLMKEKERLETNIEALTDMLNAPNMPGLTGNIIDKDGFPRWDIDLYQVREWRNKIACYQNDHKAVMKKLEEALYRLHETSGPVAVKRGSEVAWNNSSGSSSGGGVNGWDLLGGIDMSYVGPWFALIDEVSADSPWDKWGLKVNDKVKRFGTIQLGPKDQATVADCFASLRSQVTQGEEVFLVVENTEDKVERRVRLVPQTWAGPGLLGCHLVPFDA